MVVGKKKRIRQEGLTENKKDRAKDSCRVNCTVELTNCTRLSGDLEVSILEYMYVALEANDIVKIAAILRAKT